MHYRELWVVLFRRRLNANHPKLHEHPPSPVFVGERLARGAAGDVSFMPGFDESRGSEVMELERKLTTISHVLETLYGSCFSSSVSLVSADRGTQRLGQGAEKGMSQALAGDLRDSGSIRFILYTSTTKQASIFSQSTVKVLSARNRPYLDATVYS